jgi:23S rRNA (cytidine2498-2'-O)-methyltransferase
LKGELARRWPEFRFAYSRPGFLTFKLPAEHGLADDFDLQSVFARSYGFSLGKTRGASLETLARGALDLARGRDYARLHVWPRDVAPAGTRGHVPHISLIPDPRIPTPAPPPTPDPRILTPAGPTPAYEPGFTAASREAETALRQHWSELLGTAPPERRLARPGDLTLDCVLVEPSEWWIGYHCARRWASRRPGGLSRLRLPEDAVSRAYLKMEEALRWSRLPLVPGQSVVELGAAPGGSCQALLRRGLLVTGVDPAEMDAVVLAHPRFTHVRKRAAEVRRREFRGVQWLVADLNVAPNYTLDTVEAIVRHPQVNIRGLLLTLKLPAWDLADEAPNYLARIRSWGFRYVHARQLQYNHQEFCVAAHIDRGRRRLPSG